MRSSQNSSGSVILGTLIIAIVLSAVAGLYLATVLQEVRFAHQTRLSLETVNVAEAGAEDALYALINNDWSGWTEGSAGYSRQAVLPAGSSKETRTVRTFIEFENLNSLSIITEGIITHPYGLTASKQLQIDLGRSGFFSNGITSRNGITMSGNNTAVDSYNSKNGPYDASTNRNDQGSVASTSVEVNAVDTQNADIFGFIATGGAAPRIGAKGTVRGWDTDDEVSVDIHRISTDFYASFPPVTIPELTSPYTTVSSATIGITGAATDYHLPDLNIDDTWVVQGNVTLVVDGDIDIKGELKITPGSTLTLYVAGDVTVGGNGMVNMTNKPSSLALYGTAPEGEGQEIKLHGNGAMMGAVYAPYANINLKGGGNSGVMFGSLVGNHVSINGNYSFHYDEALKEFGTEGKYSLIAWRELSSAESRKADVLGLINTGI